MVCLLSFNSLSFGLVSFLGNAFLAHTAVLPQLSKLVALVLACACQPMPTLRLGMLVLVVEVALAYLRRHSASKIDSCVYSFASAALYGRCRFLPLTN